MSDWVFEGKTYEGPSDPKELYGFVYRITRKDTGKFYIGRKNFWKPKYNTVKGKRKKSLVESDWRDYWSSSEKLNADLRLLGEENFSREILELVKYKGMLSYLETRSIIINRCLELSSDECYNSFLGCKIHRNCVRY